MMPTTPLYGTSYLWVVEILPKRHIGFLTKTLTMSKIFFATSIAESN